MFNVLTPKPDDVLASDPLPKSVANSRSWRSPSLLAATLTGILLLTGCQDQSDSAAEDNAASQTSEQQRLDANKSAPQSDSAAARIEQFQPLYVTQMQSLQRRLQAEYESLQAADASDSDTISLLNGTTESADKASANSTTPNAGTMGNVGSKDPTAINEQKNDTIINDLNGTNTAATTDTDVEINTSTEVGERDLEVLKRISLEPREPEILSEAQMIERYQQALQALYQPATTVLSAQEIDTLLNIATLVPQLFEDAEIAERVSVKSPALARLIIQHQVWQQIEAQQVLDMQQMKVAQQQEFETLMTKFNDTIKGYDEQIAKYEQTLKEFQ